MLDRQHLVQGHQTIGIDRDAERYRPANAANPALDQRVADLVQQDRLAGRHIVETAVDPGRGNIERINRAARAIRAIVDRQTAAQQRRKARAVVGRQVGLVDQQARLAATRRTKARAIILELQILANVHGQAGGISVTVGCNDAQGHQAIGRQCRGAGAGFDRVSRIIVLDRTQLIQGHIARTIHGDREDELIGGRCAAFDDRAVHDQIDLLAGRNVDDSGRAGGHAKCIADRIGYCRAIGTEAGQKGTGKAVGVVDAKGAIVDNQNWFADTSGNGWRIILDSDRDCTTGRDLLAVADTDWNHETGPLLAAGSGMIDRAKQGDGVSTDIVDHDCDNRVAAG